MLPWANPSPQPKPHIDRFSCFCTSHRRVSLYFPMGRFFPSQNMGVNYGGTGGRVPQNLEWGSLLQIVSQIFKKNNRSKFTKRRNFKRKKIIFFLERKLYSSLEPSPVDVDPMPLLEPNLVDLPVRPGFPDFRTDPRLCPLQSPLLDATE